MNQFPLVPAKAGTPEGLGSRCVGMIGVFDRGSDRPPSRPNEHRLPILFRDEHGPRVIVLLRPFTQPRINARFVEMPMFKTP